MELLGSCDLLDKGHHLYTDSWYTSPELCLELEARDTLLCGTVRNRKGLPPSLVKLKTKGRAAGAVLEKGDCVWRRSDQMLVLKWEEKTTVHMLSSIHRAVYLWTGKKNRETQEPVYKPEAVVQYTKFMGGVDLSDQLMGYYHFLRKTNSWSQKLTIHMLNMIVANAYALNRKFGVNKLNHNNFREYLAEYLLKQAGCQLELQEPTEGHWPEKIPPCGSSGKVVPLRCRMCTVTPATAARKGVEPNRKSSSIRCCNCKVPLCIHPCFRVYHTTGNVPLM
jgi:hypothetical protein